MIVQVAKHYHHHIQYSLFQYLKSQFQFALIVSHIDSMRDAVDSLLEIKKENNFSNIKFD